MYSCADSVSQTTPSDQRLRPSYFLGTVSNNLLDTPSGGAASHSRVRQVLGAGGFDKANEDPELFRILNWYYVYSFSQNHSLNLQLSQLVSGN